MELGILCDPIALGRGGMEQIAASLTDHLVPRGHEVSLIFEGVGFAPCYPIERSVRLMTVEQQQPAIVALALAGEMP